MIRLITFSDARMTTSRQVLCDSALYYGIESIKGYGPDDLPEWLYKAHPYMLDPNSKGFGWYAWKPWLVFNEIMRMKDGDLLIYADAGQTLVEDPRKVFEACPQDIILFSNGWPHVEWCKGDVLKEILHRDIYGVESEGGTPFLDWPSSLKGLQQTQASLIFLRITPASRMFVHEWFAWSLMPGFIDNNPSIAPNYPTFQEHRWDQAILGCLAIKHNIPLEWFPTITNFHREGAGVKYPAIVDHHRRRNRGATNGTDSEW